MQGQYVFRQINARLFLKLRNDEVDDALVKVFTTQEGVAIGGEHFELFFAIDVCDLDDRHVKRTATQVVHSNLAIAFFGFVQTKGQCCGSGLVDDALDVQTCDATGIFGGLALCVVEIRWNGDDRFSHFFAEIVFGSLLHLAQNFSADLWRG